jgi:hypothetical protein
MTLQGAVAHCDMPVESGPTRLLPFSQLLPAGYMAYRRPEIVAFFDDHAVQLPLAKGDGLFFNPALYHAAGENRSADIQRMANLLQVSSAFGRAMEAMDRTAMCLSLYPALRWLKAEGRLSTAETAAAIGAAAEGYPFPTNLDTDPPVGGLAPESQAALVARALAGNWETAAFAEPGWSYVGFDLHRLAPGETAQADTATARRSSSSSRGARASRPRAATSARLGDRMDVFERQAAALPLRPERDRLDGHRDDRLHPRRLHRAGAGRASRAGDRPRGHRARRRAARAPTPATSTTSRWRTATWPTSLLVTEVFTPAGHWSSYPPHRHDEDDFPDMTYSRRPTTTA